MTFLLEVKLASSIHDSYFVYVLVAYITLG